MQTRRYDIDWLRVIAIGFLLIYHVAIPFQPWGVFIGFIQNTEPVESLWVPMSLLNMWRIPLLFFVSGMGVYFSMRKRDWGKLLKERTLRILLPFVGGMLLIVPLQNLIWQDYYSQSLQAVFHPAHLWFLGNIFSYVLLLSPVLFYLKKNEETLKAKIAKMVDHPIKLILLTIPFILAAMIIQPDYYAMYAMTVHGYVLGFLAFFMGYLLVFAGNTFWHTVERWKWMFTGIGFIMFMVRIMVFETEGPLYLMSIETLVWIYAILGIGYRYLNVSTPSLKYLSEAAYPVYIVHWIFIHIGSYWLFPLEMPAIIKFVGVTVITFAGSLAFHHVFLRNINFIRPLFGLKLKTRKAEAEKPLALQTQEAYTG